MCRFDTVAISGRQVSLSFFLLFSLVCHFVLKNALENVSNGASTDSAAHTTVRVGWQS